MRIKVQDIPEAGMQLNASAPRDEWFVDLLKVLEDYHKPESGKGDSADLRLQLVKTCENVFISGQVEADLRPVCDRCLAEFERHFVVPVRLHLTPKTIVDEADGAEVLEDEDFAFYQNHEIDLDRLLQETIALEIPLRDLCREDCLGLCPRCGKDLNQGKCGC